MTISVIIPVYKVEKYVRRCLESVIDQESNGFNIECLIVDDCSPDGSMTIVEDIIKNYHGSSISFKIIKHEENKGLSAARNTGIKASTGDFLFFIDSDDSILENTFKNFVAYSVEYPFADMILGNSLGTEDNYLSNTSVTKNDNSPCFIEDKRRILYLVLMRRIDRHAWNKLVRRSLVVDNDLYFDIGLLYEDVTWTYRLYSCVSSILIVPELTYMYEYNPSSIVHTPAERSSKMIKSFVFISEFLVNNPPKINKKESFFTEHSLFVYHWMIQTVDLCDKFGAHAQTRVKFNALKRRLFWRSVYHLRLIMALYFLTLFKPFSWLLKMRVYRSNIDRINHVVYQLS
jgi:glycosyltransferase involved in cell wall biosynthesis